MSERRPAFKVFQGKDRKWRWRLVAGNGRVLAVGEACATKATAAASARRMAQAAASAAAHGAIDVVVCP
jgi:uncharacterized protein YegP (UPF0339 family)